MIKNWWPKIQYSANILKFYWAIFLQFPFEPLLKPLGQGSLSVRINLESSETFIFSKSSITSGLGVASSKQISSTISKHSLVVGKAMNVAGGSEDDSSRGLLIIENKFFSPNYFLNFNLLRCTFNFLFKNRTKHFFSSVPCAVGSPS